MTGPFYDPGAPPTAPVPQAIGNLLSRVRTLEAVVPPTFEFIPDRPYALGSGSETSVQDGFPFTTVIYHTLTPFDTLQYDPTVFTSDTMDTLYLDKEGLYQIEWLVGLASSLGSANDYFRGPVWAQSSIGSGGGVGGQMSSYVDNTGVYNTWTLGGSATVYVLEADLPVIVNMAIGHYCVNTGPHGAVGDPIDLNVLFSLMATYLDGFSPDQP